MPTCPLCSGEIPPEDVRLVPFTCAHCGKRIKPADRPSYLWLRTLLCLGIAIGAARSRGWDWSFLIFVIGFYALPVFFLFDRIRFTLFPPKKFEPAQPYVQTLDL